MPVVIVLYIIGISALAMAIVGNIKIRHDRVRAVGQLPLPIFRIATLWILGGRDDARKLVEKIKLINKVATSKYDIDESIFSRDIEVLLEEEVKAVEEGRLNPKKHYAYESSNPPQLYPDVNKSSFDSAGNKPKLYTPRPNARPAHRPGKGFPGPQKQNEGFGHSRRKTLSDLEASIVSLLEKVDQDELYEQGTIRALNQAGDWVRKVDNYYHNKLCDDYTKRYEDFKKQYKKHYSNGNYYSFYSEKRK